MDKLELLLDLDDKELDSLMEYTLPFTSENNENIKNLFAAGCDKLKEEKMQTRKKTKFTVAIIAAALFCLTTITAIAANQGAFYGLFRNLDDVVGYVQYPNMSVTSQGITMELTSYLADESGFAVELTFTKSGRGTFAADTVGIGSWDWFHMRAADDVNDDVIINSAPADVMVDDRRIWAASTHVTSEDGGVYRNFTVAHHNLFGTHRPPHLDATVDGEIPVDISVNRLIYNIEAKRETVNLDFYELYQASEVAEMRFSGIHEYDIAWVRHLFDNSEGNLYETESGIQIHSIIFVRATHEWNMDIPYSYMVGIRYTTRQEAGQTEMHFDIMGLTGNEGPLDLVSVNRETGIGYKFFKIAPCMHELMNYGISSFEHLQNIDGIEFEVFSNNFIAGDWHIQTQITANREASHVVLDKAIDSGDPDFVPVFVYANIALFSTTIAMDVLDSSGRAISTWEDSHAHDPFFDFTRSDDFSLRYENGEEVVLQFNAFAAGDTGGRIRYWFTSSMPTSYEYFVLMNTSQLVAIIVDGVEFLVE